MLRRLLGLAILLAWSAAPALADRESAHRELLVKEKLRTVRVSLDFTDAPLGDVAAFLAASSGVNFVIDPQIYKDRAPEELKVSLTVKDLTLANVLALLTRMTKIQAELREGVMVLTTTPRTSGKMVVRVYDLRDMTFTIRDFKGPNIRLAGAGKIGTEIDFGSEPKGTGPSADELIELIKGSTGDVWGAAHPQAAVSRIGGFVVVTHNEEVHRRVIRLLVMLRAQR